MLAWINQVKSQTSVGTANIVTFIDSKFLCIIIYSLCSICLFFLLLKKHVWRAPKLDVAGVTINFRRFVYFYLNFASSSFTTLLASLIFHFSVTDLFGYSFFFFFFSFHSFPLLTEFEFSVHTCLAFYYNSY